ncbi:hypothetical protein E2C01_029263 [Portunus trituberculatus]|uniref:Uncharacterized protein n=1 Tax=Portunus trituberculatus TaxID=210409 RepID=A0A5B7ERH9_PORTR|nr:hypothetical protein [Portunus trituberculatus]
MGFHVPSKVGAGHVLSATDVTDESLVSEVNRPDVARHILVGLEGSTTVLAGEAAGRAVSAAVVFIQGTLVERLVTLVTAVAPLIGVQDHVVAVGLLALQAFVAHLTHMCQLTSVHLHVVQPWTLVITLVALVAAWRPVSEFLVGAQASLLIKGLPTGLALVLRLPGGQTQVDLLVVHTGFQQALEHLTTLRALVIHALRSIILIQILLEFSFRSLLLLGCGGGCARCPGCNRALLPLASHPRLTCKEKQQSGRWWGEEHPGRSASICCTSATKQGWQY